MAANFTAYKIHKQMYPATYNFKADTDAAEPTGWTTNNGGTTTTVIAASQGIHKKVLVCTDADGANTYDIEIDFSSAQTSGIIDLWFQTDDNTAISYLQLLQADNTVAIQVDLNAIAGVGDDTWYHYSISFDCTPDTYQHWLDGTSIASGVAFTNAVTSIITIKFTSTAAASVVAYFDAIGFSWDSDYVSGDNIFWRNLKDQDSAFEAEALYTSSTSIGFIDAATVDANNTVTIEPSFDEHKKILRLDDTDAGGATNCRSNFSSAQVSGTIEFNFRVSDATSAHQLMDLINESVQDALDMRVGTDTDEFLEYFDGAWHTIVVISDNTWYHLKVEFECGAGGFKGLAADTWNVWVNNVKYGPFNLRNVSDTLDYWFMGTLAADQGSMDIDAVSYSWTSGNKIADNRTFEYHTESYDDITSNIEKCYVTDRGYDGSTAFITDDTTLTLSELHLIQIYDENNDLRFEGNITRTDNADVQNRYPLLSLNNDALMDENSYTASSAEDVNASLLSIHTNVSQIDGRLIYYTEDDPAGNLTPNFRNKPKKMGIRWFAIHGGKAGPIQANGVFTLDDDRNPENGAATISDSSGGLMGQPKISVIKHQINYVEVRGGIDPDTGTPFSGISQDTTVQADGTGTKRYYKRFRELQSDTDCANRATQIRTGNGFEPTIIEVTLGSIYALPGEIINFAYSPFSFSATNCFVESVTFNLVQATARYRLNTGIFGIIALNTAGYTLADETADDVAETLFNTDLITVYPQFSPAGGAAWASRGVQCNVIPEAVHSHIYLDTKVDTSRDLVLNWIWIRNDANADTIAAILSIIEYNISAGTNNILENVTPIVLNACAAAKYEFYSYTIAAADLNSGSIYYFEISLNEARDLTFSNFVGRYYAKRTV